MERKMKGSEKKELVFETERTLGSLVGCLLYAVGLNFFIVPAGFYTGGLVGVCQVIRTLLVEYAGLNFGTLDITGILYWFVNVPILFLSAKALGKLFLAKTILGVTAMSLFMSVVPCVQLVSDPMAASVVGAIVSGAGVGIVLKMGSSGGGMDAIGILLTKRKADYSVGRVNLAINILLYGVCLFLFDVEIVIYSLIYAAVYSVAMDRVHTQNINVEVNIITKLNTAELEKEVFSELGRGITKWNSLGAYTYEQSHILYIMLSKYEVNQLKTIVRKYDPDAFIVVNEGVSVDGNYLRKL